MAYRFDRGESVQRNLRRISLQQIDKAIAEVVRGKLNLQEKVHQVRKRCKKLRGLLRLVRSSFDDYQRENEFFRDAARKLSHFRDAQAIIDCFEDLTEHFGHEIAPEAIARTRETLIDRRDAATADAKKLNDALEEFAIRMRDARKRATKWSLKERGFPALRGGLEATYGRGRDTVRETRHNPTAASFHELRKRVKDHWYHVRLLGDLWPQTLEVRCQAAAQLGEQLGGAHDLVVFRQALSNAPDHFGSGPNLSQLLSLADRRQAQLEAGARPLAERLFAEKPKHLAHRLSAYWKTWRDGRKRTRRRHSPGLSSV